MRGADYINKPGFIAVIIPLAGLMLLVIIGAAAFATIGSDVTNRTTGGQAAFGSSNAQIADDGQGSIKGMDPLASSALRRAGLTADDVMQGLGNVDASAGIHLAEPGSTYTAAVDIRVRGRSDTDIGQVLHNMRLQGFAAWYRPPSLAWGRHIHAIYAGVPLKESSEKQVRDFIGVEVFGSNNDQITAPRDGQAGHQRVETNYPPSNDEVASVRQVYLAIR